MHNAQQLGDKQQQHLSDLGDLNVFTDYFVLLESINLVKILVTLAEKIVMNSLPLNHPCPA